MKSNKPRVKEFSPFQPRIIEEYLADMSGEGMFLKSITYSGKMIFEKSEPNRLKYCVNLYDTDDEGEFDEYLRSQKEAGWSFVCRYKDEKVNIFCSENPDEIPISQNADLKLKYLKEKAKQLEGSIFGGIFSIFTCVTIGLIMFYNYIMYFLSSNLFTIAITYVIIYETVLLISNILQLGSIKRLIKKPDDTKTYPRKHRRIYTYSTLLLVLILFGAFISESIGFYNYKNPKSEIPKSVDTIVIEKYTDYSIEDFKYYKGPKSIFTTKNYELQNKGDKKVICIKYTEFLSESLARFAYKNINLDSELYAGINPVELTEKQCIDAGIDEGKNFEIINEDYSSAFVFIRDNCIYQIIKG